MRTKLLFFFFFVFSQLTLANTDIQFISPQPNSKYVKTSTSIILRLTAKPDKNSIKNSSIQITGSKSGSHESTFKMSSDGLTMIFTPVIKFQYDENIQVKIKPVKTDLSYSDPINYSFETEKESISISSTDILKKEMAEFDNSTSNSSIPFINNRASNLPSNFPQISVSNSTNPSSDYIFLSNFSLTTAMSTGYYLMILDNTGTPVFYKELDSAAYDFKKQPNGNLTYYSARAQKFIEMNSNYQIIDSFECGNGYTTDMHELRLYNNRHAFLMSYDPQRVNMANLVSRGDSNAIVLGLIIQELDENKNVIFQWRSWDYFNILDARRVNFTDPVIDYAHGNAIELCSDGNIMISSRHLDEITKINRSNGNIIWRLGGANNQFRFINETIAFSHQHAIRELPNGNITLFDNGNYPSSIDPIHEQAPVSRAIEYQLNEANKIATLVWQYVNTPAIFGFAMGYTERLPNGNTFICWGAAAPAVTEVDASGQKVFEMNLPPGQYSYRALRDSWNPLPNNGVPVSYKVYQNYPNPFNPGTTIRFDLPEQGDVKISIFNMLGQVVQEELRSNQPAGIHTFAFNGSNLTSGVYFYHIKSNTFTDTKRMVLVK